ncbi:MAG: hypothetical protein NC489_23275 [Ruminococcus flavefaciens]|nr:hypothetical protein [Eubacterium sp.]MCM1233056.1 hypothetical protein [Ruminococcus flavefaciens]
MIHTFYTLKKEYQDKKICIWDVNEDSIGMFAMLAFRRIDIFGFVTSQKEYVGEIYMNRPILDIEQTNQEMIVLVYDSVLKEIMDKLIMDNSNITFIYWSDALAINEQLRKQPVVIYGIGAAADKLTEVLKSENIDVDLYCVTKKTQVSDYRGKRIIEVADLEKYRDCAVLIGAARFNSRFEMLNNLSNFQGDIYLKMENVKFGNHMANLNYLGAGLLDIPDIMLMQYIDLARRRHRKIYLYGCEKNLLADLITDVLRIYNIGIEGYVCEKKDERKHIQSIYDLAYESVEDKLIIIYDEFPQQIIEDRANIELAGFSLENENYTALQCYTYSNDKMMLKWREYPDPLVGHSQIITNAAPGWKIYGTEEGTKIVILGGSTSSELYHPENWVSKLYYLLSDYGFNITVYNGAHPGNDIVAELLRFLRDGYVLQPQIVVSMSGVNNIFCKEADNQFNERILNQWMRNRSPNGKYCSGIYSDEPVYQFWLRNVKLLKMVSEFYGAQFYCFLQPISMLMENMTVYERSVFGERTSRAYKDSKSLRNREFGQYIESENENYINIVDLLDHKEGMYLDSCHYTDKANEVIAKKVYEIIAPVVREFQ